MKTRIFGCRLSIWLSLALVLFVAAGTAAPASAQTQGATITWTPPTTRSDGSAVELRGFYVYRGSASDSLYERTFVPGATTVTYSFAALPSGTSYFAVAAVDTAGNESEVSAIVSKAITGSACDAPSPSPSPSPSTTPTPTPTPTPTRLWTVAKYSLQTTRPAYPVTNGVRGTISTSRATVGAACDCAAPIREGLTTYCPFAGSGAAVSMCTAP